MQENNKQLLKKLHDIQKKILYFQKDATGHNYKYVSGTEILSKIRPLMDEKGLLLIQGVKEIKVHELKYNSGDKEKTNNVTEVIFAFTWIDIESGESLIIPFAGQGQDNQDKGFGMACTYAERYFLLKFFHVPTDEDDIDLYYKKMKELENEADSMTKATPEQIEELIKESEKYILSENQQKLLISWKENGMNLKLYKTALETLSKQKLKDNS